MQLAAVRQCGAAPLSTGACLPARPIHAARTATLSPACKRHVSGHLPPSLPTAFLWWLLNGGCSWDPTASCTGTFEAAVAAPAYAGSVAWHGMHGMGPLFMAPAASNMPPPLPVAALCGPPALPLNPRVELPSAPSAMSGQQEQAKDWARLWEEEERREIHSEPGLRGSRAGAGRRPESGRGGRGGRGGGGAAAHVAASKTASSHCRQPPAACGRRAEQLGRGRRSGGSAGLGAPPRRCSQRSPLPAYGPPPAGGMAGPSMWNLESEAVTQTGKVSRAATRLHHTRTEQNRLASGGGAALPAARSRLPDDDQF